MVPSLGLTLINVTNEWQAGRWDLSGVLEAVAEHGIGPDVELVGYQSFATLPFPSAEEVRTFRADVDRLGLRPVCFGVYVEWLRRRDHWLSEDEAVSSLETQIEVAAGLGFPMVRAPIGISPEILARLLPVLDRRRVVLTLEVQGPARHEDPVLGDLLAGLRCLDSEWLGITLDTSVAMPRIPVTLVDSLDRAGMSARGRGLLADWWEGGDLGEAIAALGSDEGDRRLIPTVMSCFFRFGRSSPDDWMDWLPWTRHVHAKIWDWVAPDVDVVPAQSAFLSLLAAVGYAGSVVSEWGGSAWLDSADIHPLELTRAHLDLLTRHPSTVTEW